MFSKAQVGDKVYDLRFGEGEIKGAFGNGSIHVLFQTAGRLDYTLDGRQIGSTRITNQMLFWGAPTIIGNPPPKRKVKKIGWINIYTGGIASNVHESEAAAHKSKVGNALLATVPVEWEEEE